MRNTHAGIGIGLIIGVLALQAPAAGAVGDSNLRINPGSALPGSTVTVSTTACGPDVTYGKGESEVGGQFHLFQGDRKGVLTGEFQVPGEGKPGIDTVTVKCPPRIQITDTYQIVGQSPFGGVKAGFGGTENTQTYVALGGGLITVAAAGALVRMRRRSQGDPA